MSAGSEISACSQIPPIYLLFTHFHIDHVVGLPCFSPLYDKNAQIKIMADPKRETDWKKTLGNFMAKPYWPVRLGDVDAVISLQDLPKDTQSLELCGTRISWFRVPHPQSCLAYRIETTTFTVIVATDVEYRSDTLDPRFVDFCKNADFLIFDAQYLPEEYPRHAGWGHSTWETAVKLADKTQPRKLILTHHAPERTDEAIDGLVAKARRIYANTDGAAPNMIFTSPS